MELKKEIINLFGKTATQLPEDVISALKKAQKNENSPAAKKILAIILKNAASAKSESRAICQDTGTPIICVKCPRNQSQKELQKIINKSAIIATKEVPLRPNAVDALTNKNYGNVPITHFEESNKFAMDLMLKGGGSENITQIYSLPNKELDADRNLKGVEKCVLDAVFKAQGKGCPPYIIGAAIGGMADDTARLAKEQLFRKIGDKNKNKELARFEKNILKKINKLGIGPMGLGGKTTALAVKMASTFRNPPSFFVVVSFGCWCVRRQSLKLKN